MKRTVYHSIVVVRRMLALVVYHVFAVAAIAQDAEDCFPPCRAGYICSNGQCIELCNPPCPVGERCSAGGECIDEPAQQAPAKPLQQPVPTPAILPSVVEPKTVETQHLQEDKEMTFPWSALTSSFGYGSAHGGLGAKTIFGPFILGLGKLYDFTWYEIGLQIPLLNFYGAEWPVPMAMAVPHSYFQYNYGIIAVASESYSAGGVPTVSSSTRVVGNTVMLGYVHYFGREYRLVFIDASMGYSWAKDPVTFFKGTPYETKTNVRSFAFDIGLGINLGPILQAFSRNKKK